MIYSDRRYFALDSMGFVLDNMGGDPLVQFMFMPEDGSVVYNPSTGRIETYAVDALGCHVASYRPASVFELYLNLATKRAYEWNGSQMVETDLSVVLSEETIVGDTTFTAPNTTYHITSVITGTVTIGAGSTLFFHNGGRFVSCVLTGESIKVVPNGEQTIFENCNFANCTFVDSSLCATNFGAVADMDQDPPTALQFKDLPTMQIITRGGTDNWSQFQKMASFLSGSSGIKLHINGSFYISSAKMADISNARDLEVYGDVAEPGQNPPCEIIVGFNLYDCVDVFIHDLSFVGFHLPHDFPTICPYPESFKSNLRRYVSNPNDAIAKIAYDEFRPWAINHLGIDPDVFNSYFLTLDEFDLQITDLVSSRTYTLETDGAESLGLANNGVMAFSETEMASCMHVWVDHCHFEMRQNCILGLTHNARVLGPNEELLEMFDVQGTNCTFSHIYFQPLASHCHGSFFENCTGDYICQPIDWSECANHSRARNCHFTNCLIGPKQEYRPGRTEVNHRNSIEDCSFEITDPFWTLGMKHFILQASQGAIGDTMTVRNTTFKVRKRHPYYGIFCRSWRTLFKDVSLQLGYAPDETGDNSELAKLDNLFYRDGDSTPVSLPVIELHNFELKAYSKVSYLFRYNIRAIIRDSEFTLTQSAVSCFEMLKEASVNNSVFNFASGVSYFAVYTPLVTIDNTTVNGGLITYFLHHYTIANVLNGGVDVVYDFTVRNSVFSNVGTFLYLNGKTNLHLSGNNIVNDAFINNALDDDYDVRIYVYGNRIQLRGQAFRNVTSRLFGSDFLVANNFFTSTTVQRILADAVRTEYADQVYNNFFLGKVIPLNEGNDANRPLHPWNGMVYYNVNMGEYDVWGGQFWTHWSYPDEE